MLCNTFAELPAPPLDTCVERRWLLVDAPAYSKERIAASGTIDLGINLHENQLRIYDPGQPERSKRFSGAVVSGTHSRPFVIDPRELVSVIGVRFKPGGAFLALDGVYTPDQSALAKWFLDHDRGHFVRTEAAHRAILSSSFPGCELHVYHDLLRIPYSLVVAKCSNSLQ